MKLLPLVMAAVMAVAATAQTALDRCRDCRTARIWPTTNGTFPEAAALRARRPAAADFGIAFSGGGTRAASATTGQLRGLARNGWLEKARYMTAVSGGAWAAVPYTFTVASDRELLGPFVTPEQLDVDHVRKEADGRLAESIGAKKLPVASIKEAIWRLTSPQLKKESERLLRQGLSMLLQRREGARGEKTYSRLIGNVFIDPIIDPVDKLASRRLFAWDDESLNETINDNPGLFSHIQFLTSDARQRPFLIVGGTVASMRELYAYPLLMPIEYTPLYTGIRHQFGEKWGGTYLSSWAYDHMPAGPATATTLPVHEGESDRKFTIADVAAASGSAPALAVLLGEHYDVLPEWARNASAAAASVFPSFRHFTIQRDGGVIVSAPAPHGDGGFTDNFGLMPLLARGVKNIIVFANVNNEYDRNDDLASYFEEVPNPGPTGNKLRNRVFERSGLVAIKAQFRADAMAHRPLVYCGAGWNVLPNDFYEVKPYRGVNICWMYIHLVQSWSDRICDARLRVLLAGKDFETFPWYDTFKQLELDISHVNLLADLTSWVMTDPEVVRRIRTAIPELPAPIPPPVAACPGSSSGNSAK